MSKHIQLSISNPCHEDWDNMTRVEKGKFCGSCQKQVIDFSNMSDREVAQFFRKPSAGSVCGRFMQDQLDRSIEVPRKRIPWVKYFFQFALPAFLLSCRDNLQGKIKVTETEITPESKYTTTVGMVMSEIENSLLPDTTCIAADSSIEQKVDTTFDLIMPYVSGDISVVYIERSVIIKGNVIDEDDNPIPMASVKIESISSTSVADSLGYFSVTINSDQKVISIEISSTGYKSKKINYIGTDSLLNIKLEPEFKLLDSAIVTANTGKFTRGLVTGSYTVCKKSKIIAEVKSQTLQSDNSIKVFPNPVKSGTIVHLEWMQINETGSFSMQLFTQSGQLAFTKETRIDKNTHLSELQLPLVASGSYFLRVSNKESGKSFTKKIIIQ